MCGKVAEPLVNLTKNPVRRQKKRLTKDDFQLTVLATPSLIWYALFAFLPMFGIIIAFKNMKFQAGHGFFYNLITSPWSGLSNFEYLFKTQDAWIILRNTLGYNIIFIALGVVIPVTLAIAISQLYSTRLAKGVQTAMFLPHFMSWVVITYFVGAFLQYDMGLINRSLAASGQAKVNWYMEPDYWPYILIVLRVWKTMGYGMVVYLASITGQDAQLYEAALIDGATRWQQIRRITLPLLKPVMIMMFILALGGIFYSDFGLFYQVPKGSASLYEVTETLDVYVYRALSKTTNIARSSAAGFIQSTAGCLTILGANWLVRRIDPDSALM